MAYIEETCISGEIIEVCKYHTYRYNKKGIPRSDWENVTTEKQKAVNHKNAVKRLRRLMNANFKDGDLLITYDFRPEDRPSNSDDLGKVMTNFLRRLRRECKKAGTELKYIYVKELGKRGACHAHMIMGKVPVDTLRKCWTLGGIHIDPLYTQGQYEKIAEYFVKYADKTEDTEGCLLGKKWYPSRNLKKPVIKKRVITSNSFKRNYIPEKKGYYLEKESLTYGIDCMGYEFMRYFLHRDRGKPKAREKIKRLKSKGEQT